MISNSSGKQRKKNPEDQKEAPPDPTVQLTEPMSKFKVEN
jgi:hypothetical protein